MKYLYFCSVALNDVVLLRDTLRKLPDLTDYKTVRRHTHALYWQRKTQHSFVVNILAQALYELFAAQDGKYCQVEGVSCIIIILLYMFLCALAYILEI